MKIQNITNYNMKANTYMNFKGDEKVSQSPIEKITVSKEEYDKLKTEHDQFISAQKKKESKEDMVFLTLLMFLLSEHI